MLEEVIEISRRAGGAILDVYETADFGVEMKSDDSPLTKADLASHREIVKGLAEAFPDIPVLSEESDDIDWPTRSGWSRYFLIDPLDGTKEFISRNGEFTVNIALIEDGVPVMGVVYVPVQATVYAGDRTEETQAFVERDGERRAIRARELAPRLRDRDDVVVVASRRHGSEALERCLEVLNDRFESVSLTSMGSSLKLCLVAEGEADFYPRLAPTSEWDTAAAQAVVEAAGGQVVDTSLMALRYNTKENILNPYFYVIADPGFPWADVLSAVSVDD